MCLPVLALAGIGAAIGGTGLKFFGEKKAASAKERTFVKEQDRQKAFGVEQNARFQDSLAQTASVVDPAAVAKAAGAREAVLNAATHSAGPGADGYLPGSASAPSVVNDAAVRAGAASDAATSNLARTLAALGGTTDQLGTTDRGIGRNSMDIAQIGGFRRGSLDVLPAEMTAAAAKGKNLRAIGGLAQQIGMAMATSGVGGAASGGLSPELMALGRTPLAMSASAARSSLLSGIGTLV